jgi:hypothetical protein
MKEDEIIKIIREGQETLRSNDFNQKTLEQLAMRKKKSTPFALADERMLVGFIVCALFLSMGLLSSANIKGMPIFGHLYSDLTSMVVLILLLIAIPLFIISFRLIHQKIENEYL